MSVRYTYLALEEDHQLISNWFSNLSDEMTVSEQSDRIIYYFRAMATRPLPNADEIDQDITPLVLLTKPRQRRGTLWTDSEVLFTPTPLKPQFPRLNKISQSFSKWLKQFDLVFSHQPTFKPEWNYYLEAGIRNVDNDIYALPMAMHALRSGQYFVHHLANEIVLDTLAKKLLLREYYTDPA